MAHTYTPEQIEFIKENVSGRSHKELLVMFNDYFGLELGIGQIKSYLKNHNLRSDSKITYSSEQIQFIADNIKGRSYQELTDMFNNQFGTKLKACSMPSLACRNGLRNERDCRLKAGSKIGAASRFGKGHIPNNKGKKGTGGWEPTQFKHGQMPWNYKPVGTERINGDGYADVKIADPNKWKAKHIIIWEAAHGPVPKGHVVIFADGNKQNVTLENLLMISQRELSVMNNKRLITSDPELTKTGVVIADIYLKIGERKKRRGRGN